MNLRALIPGATPPIKELCAIDKNNDTLDAKRNAAVACIDRFLTKEENRSLRRGARLCEAISKQSDRRVRDFVLGDALFPTMRARSPRFVAGEALVRNYQNSDFIADSIAAGTVGVLAGRGQGTWDAKPLSKVVRRLMREHHYDERVSMAAANQMKLVDLKASVAYVQTEAAQRLLASGPDRQQRVSAVKARLKNGGRRMPSATAEEIEAGKLLAAHLKGANRAKVSFGTALLGVNKDLLFAECARGMNIADLRADFAFASTPAGKKFKLLEKHSPAAQIVKQAMASPKGKQALETAIQQMRNAHREASPFGGLFGLLG